MNSDRLFDDEKDFMGPDRRNPAVPRSPEDPRPSMTRRSALWAAYGDALGWISELTDAAGLRRRTKGEDLRVPVEWKRQIGGRSGVNVVLPKGCYSDDTQLRLATGRAIGSHGFDVEAFAKVELPVWLGYALGGGNATKAAAAHLARPTTSWFLNTYRGWKDAGGNGAAMRIQPHVWASPDLAEPKRYISDVVRNSICTHGHPVALMGAVLHAMSLAHTMDSHSIPDSDDLRRLADAAGKVPSLLSDDPEVGHYWMSSWEREEEQPFASAWKQVVQDTFDIISLAAAAVNGRGQDRYGNVLDALQLRDPARRGSGLLSAVAAVALAWCEEVPADAMIRAANALESDTDTIATMAGALIGCLADADPPTEVLDAALIRSEADRLVALAIGTDRPAHHYPDLLSWSPPKTQADALVAAPDGSLHVMGLGAVKRAVGQPLRAPQGGFLWQWVELDLGQTLLIKRRPELSVVSPPVMRIEEGSSTQEDVSEATRLAVDEWPAVNDATGHVGAARSDRPLDLDRAIAFVHRERHDDKAIGYTVRRVAREGTPEQVAAFLAVLLELLRR